MLKGRLFILPETRGNFVGQPLLAVAAAHSRLKRRKEDSQEWLSYGFAGDEIGAAFSLAGCGTPISTAAIIAVMKTNVALP